MAEDDETRHEPAPGDPGAQETPSPADEEELRARIEEGLRKVRVQDVLLESVVTLINLTARRIGKEDERDLEQARIGIDAVRALVDMLDSETASQVRAALSELQLSYARAAGGGASEPDAGTGPEAEAGGAESDPGRPPPAREEPQEGRGRQQPPPGLWVPPGSA